MPKYKTEQELFWAGDFGDEYQERNQGPELIAECLSRFPEMLRRADLIDSLVEFGPNIGNNLMALHALYPKARISAVEINPKAVTRLERNEWLDAREGSILEFSSDEKWTLSMASGILIHIAPEGLQHAYRSLYNASSRYILICEYYNPVPVEVPYRGHAGKLYKRDFAGEMLDRYKDLRLLDYGFRYRRDNAYPLDDAHWFLLEKRG